MENRVRAAREARSSIPPAAGAVSVSGVASGVVCVCVRGRGGGGSAPTATKAPSELSSRSMAAAHADTSSALEEEGL
jgi:hypothetical protein